MKTVTLYGVARKDTHPSAPDNEWHDNGYGFFESKEFVEARVKNLRYYATFAKYALATITIETED